MSSQPLPLTGVLAAGWCEQAGVFFERSVAGVRGREELTIINTIVRATVAEPVRDKIVFLQASPAQIVETALGGPREGVASDGPSSEVILVCDDIVAHSGVLRAGVLEELAVAWHRCSPTGVQETSAGKQRLRVVPEFLDVMLTLIESSELARRNRVMEKPCGVDVGDVNKLGVPSFKEQDEANLKPIRLSRTVGVVRLPIGSPELPRFLNKLSTTGADTVEAEASPELPVMSLGVPNRGILLCLEATAPGRLHGVLTTFRRPRRAVDQTGAPLTSDIHRAVNGGERRKLAGVLWPVNESLDSPWLQTGDRAVLNIRYSPSRGLVVTPIGVERRGS
eukprot:TRINITY_DN22871_c0_g1_i1.p1 TRINITY_DN22871_c0_g1~~TRINITY_DN22871_c0_g1_i1.p1  ORF type:complete len:336 (+),score=42.52 TRINITY_DN22871_c0_g1_i1:241-1248(+)